MADHRTLVSADVHEPKHISDSTSADAGKVITPLSGGTSELRYLTPQEVGINYYYGEIEADNITATISMTAATDPTLHDPADFVLLNSSRIATVYGQNFGITYDGVNNTMNVPVGGIYRVGGWFNLESSVNNTKVAIKYTLNGTPVSGVLITDIGAAGRTQNISGFGLVALSADDDIGVSLASDKTADITITDMRLNLELVKEL